MTPLILDSSIVVKRLNQDGENNLDKADKILADVEAGRVTLIAPELMKYEVGNVLLRGKQLTLKQAKVCLTTFYSVPIRFVSDTADLAQQTFLLAKKWKITYYDAAFMTLAKTYDACLITDNLKHQGRDPRIKTVALKDYS